MILINEVMSRQNNWIGALHQIYKNTCAKNNLVSGCTTINKIEE